MSHFFFNDTATTEIYTLSLHDALPIWIEKYALAPLHTTTGHSGLFSRCSTLISVLTAKKHNLSHNLPITFLHRSEEHTSELQSRQYLVCRLLLEKKQNFQAHLDYDSLI